MFFVPHYNYLWARACVSHGNNLSRSSKAPQSFPMAWLERLHPQGALHPEVIQAGCLRSTGATGNRKTSRLTVSISWLNSSSHLYFKSKANTAACEFSGTIKTDLAHTTRLHEIKNLALGSIKPCWALWALKLKPDRKSVLFFNLVQHSAIKSLRFKRSQISRTRPQLVHLR